MSTVTALRREGRHEDDVVRKLIDQHARIRGLFEEVRTSVGEQRQQAFEELRALLIVHETAEEMIVRPVIRHLLGDGEPNARNAEEADANRGLADLSALQTDDVEFLVRFAELEKSVDAHARAEEAFEFQAIAEGCPLDERTLMGRQLDAAVKVAPTRPHPGLMGHEMTVLTVGPIAALIDRVRDAIKSALT